MTDNTVFFDRGLPKWPQLMIVGDRVTESQAKEIIFRTDSFLHSVFGDRCSNNTGFEAQYRNRAKLNLERFHHTDLSFKSGNWSAITRIDELVKEWVGAIELAYIPSRFAASAFVFGPNGFCSPTGEIFHQYNVGKWPSVEDVYNDFVAIAEAFPYIKLKAALYDKEHSEDGPHRAVVCFEMENGKVTMSDAEWGQSLRDCASEEDDITAIFSHRLYDPMAEFGLPMEWYEEFASRICPIVVECVQQQAVEDERDVE